MAEFLAVLLVLFVLLVIMTVVGHGIWVLVAATFRLFVPPSPPASGGVCPLCKTPGAFVDGQCRQCGAAVRRPGFEEDRQAARRQLQWLHQRQAINNEQLAELLSLLEGGGGRLRSLPGAAGASASTAITAPPAAAETSKIPAPAEEELIVLMPAVSEPPPVVMAPAAAQSPFAATTPHAAAAARPAPWEIPDESPAPRAARAPRASLADLLTAFMERRNIRWVELISGMLIVGSFIGLVISLRTTFSEVIPYFPALMFMLGAGFFHFVGLYTLHRWKLKSTSRAILIIATLLVPLSFMASIVLSRASGRGSLDERWYWPAVVLGLVGFGAMNFFASRALLGRGWWRLVAAVMGASAGQLIVNRVTPDPTAWAAVNAAFLLPLASFVVGVGGQIGSCAFVRQLSRRRIEQTLLVLGVALFGLLTALGLLLARTHTEQASGAAAARLLAAQLSPSLCLAASLVLAVGLLIHQRTFAKALAGSRMAGTAIALFAGSLMAACMLLAWPAPVLLVGVGVAGFLTLSSLGAVARLPLMQASALACGALAWLVGFHMATGRLELWARVGSSDAGERLVAMLGTGLSSGALVVLATLVGAGGAIWKAAGRRGEQQAWQYSAAAIAALAVMVAGYVALGDFFGWNVGPGAELATLVLALGAVGLLSASFVRPSLLTSLAGGALAWVSLAHGLSANAVVHGWLEALSAKPDRPLLVATIAHSLIVAAAAFVSGWRLWPDRQSNRRWMEFAAPLSWMCLAAAACAMPFVLFGRDSHRAAALEMACLAAPVLLSAALHRSRGLFAFFQAAATMAVLFAVRAVGLWKGWWNGWPLDDAFLPLQIAALALWCALFSGLRLATAGRKDCHWLQPSHNLFSLAPATFDGALLGLLTILAGWLSASALAPKVLLELGLTSGELSSLSDGQRVFLFSARGWLALAACAAALVASLRERRTAMAMGGLVLMSFSAACLLTARMPAPAIVLGWLAAVCGAGWALALALRGPLDGILARGGFPATDSSAPRELTRWLSLALACAPVPLVAICLMSPSLRLAVPGAGDDGAGSWSISWRLSLFAAPLTAALALWLAHAAMERKTLFASSGAAFLWPAVFVAAWMGSLELGREALPQVLAAVLQWPALAMSLYVVAWLALRTRVEKPESIAAADPFLLQGPIGTCLGGVAALLAVLVVLATGAIGFAGARGNDPWSALGAWPGHAALVAALAAAVMAAGEKRRQRIAAIAAPGAIAAVAFAAASAVRWSSGEAPLAQRGLTAGWLAVCALLSGWACLRPEGDPKRRLLALWAAPLGGLVFTIALVGYNDPWRIWSPAILGAVAAVAGGATIASGRQRCAFLSTAVSLVAVYLLWWNFFAGSVTAQRLVELCQFWLLTTISTSAVWLAASIWRERRHGGAMRPAWLPSAYGFYTFAATAGVLLFHTLGLLAATLQRPRQGLLAGSDPIDVSNAWGALTTAGLGLLLFATFWDRRQKLTLPGLYAWGVAVLVLGLDQAAFPAHEMLFAAGFAASGYVALTGYLWLQGARLAHWGQSLGVEDPVEGLKRTAVWLPPISGMIALAVLLVEFIVVLSFESRTMRYCAALAPLLLAGGIACQAQQARRSLFQWATLVLLAVAAVFTAWADVAPGWSGAQTLDRLSRLVTSLSLVSFGLLFARRWRVLAEDWKAAAGRAAFTSGGFALAALLASLSAEAALFNPATGADVSHGQAAITGLALLGLAVALVWLALSKAPDPFGLSARGRMAYVYAAQVIVVLFWAHIYLVFPEEFHGRVRPYWPYVVMGIAFAGIGLSEVLRQRNVMVLAEPFERSSLLLPLAPMLGAWVIAAEKTEYWAVLFLAGLLYSLSAVFRRSFASALAAAVTGNGGLLVLLHETGYRFLEHPHFWMIPPALSVLGAAEANRRRLNEAQLTSIRYGCLLAIYISSSCEIFLVSAGKSMISPMILATLAIGGVVAGIWLKIRAFLYMGAGFVLVAVVSMVWHAQRTLEQSWPWWAFGMGLGASILAVFVMFERKRVEILGVIERLRHWEK